VPLISFETVDWCRRYSRVRTSAVYEMAKYVFRNYVCYSLLFDFP